MKRAIVTMAVLCSVTLFLNAQNTRQTETEKRETKTVQAQVQVKAEVNVSSEEKTGEVKKENETVKVNEQAGKPANHGQVVSETARTTESGKGKGQVVSEQARMNGEAQKAKQKDKTREKETIKAARPAENRPAQVKNTARTTSRRK